MKSFIKNTEVKKIFPYVLLISINLLYSFVSIFTKYASLYPYLSSQHILSIIGALCVMMIYALLWQQIIKQTALSTAYMFKGTSILFSMFLSSILFKESITLTNMIGSIIIIFGIILFAKV